MSNTVLIQGDGIAACCSARLLRAGDMKVVVARMARPKLPVILVSESAQILLRDVFEDRTLFQNSIRIRKRVVSWGRDARPRVIPHSAVVVSEEDLLNRLWPKVPASTASEGEETYWTIVTSRASDLLPSDCTFGSRIAAVTSVRLKDSADRDACWIESLDEGWLFLLACGQENGLLLSVGDAPEMHLQKSRLVEQQIEILEGPASRFPAYPRILSALCGPRWLACGLAAMAFDPLCGEGASNAVREAILASAAVRAVATGFAADEVFAHYSSRLTAGFLRHLKACHDFYISGNSGPFWESELRLLSQGIERIQDLLHHSPRSRYRLVDFELRRVDVR